MKRNISATDFLLLYYFITTQWFRKQFLINNSINTAFTTVNPRLDNVSSFVGNLTFQIDGLSTKINDAFERIGISKKRIENLSNKVKAVEVAGNKLQLQKSHNQKFDNKSIAPNCIVEFELRILRTRNIILFGLPENSLS